MNADVGRPTRRSRLGLASAVAGAAAGFFAHGGARSMRELVGFEPAAELRELLSALFLVVVFASPLLVGFALFGRRGRPASWLALGAAVLAGCALSLAWMRLDERAFEREVQIRGVDQLQGRPRWWPNTNSALVWRPGLGVHATD